MGKRFCIEADLKFQNTHIICTTQMFISSTSDTYNITILKQVSFEIMYFKCILSRLYFDQPIWDPMPSRLSVRASLKAFCNKVA